MKADIEGANRELAEARSTGKPCPPLRGRLLPEGDVESAYRVQQLQARAWQDRGERRVGAKIGLTSRVVQEAFGVFQPDFGVLTDVMAVGDGVEVDIDRLLQPRVEAEIAFVLDRDLDDPQITTVDLIRAVDHVLPAIEIVDSRIAAWDISIVDTVADNASSGLFVLGTSPRRLADVDLRLCGMVLEHAGEPVSVGAGAACLGNPLLALHWLAGTLARAGDPLRAGDVVLSGALGPMVSVTPGAAYEARISGLGSVRACFSRGESA
ncbi:2-keto-4-pentenoate hydratase [Micromonospora profundi]|uniref:Fumarylacetoacetate hydrolase family protein n=1 Tax=Micromonospora profundi TaxID=1420889 RepID=A0AAJ6L4X0_9ACTN|nr:MULTISPECIES: fumarylacetoacetate hydrolase family protein [Micromonospora]KOX10864.1 2-keto-4-pentenoate hydratase [Micromonospora sp. NRRL B-16802]NJC10530.1 2-keto-4-pentenoate hydratase [Micromonospora profundi]WLS48086.1 fumarylacetoacetate hydrolase family protein [Micromonospora profundi]